MSGVSKRTELDFQLEDVQRAPFQAADFVFDFPAAGASTRFGKPQGRGGEQQSLPGDSPQWGVAQALVTLEACAINQPHSHPAGRSSLSSLRVSLPLHCSTVAL